MSSQNDKYDYEGLMSRNLNINANVRAIANDKGIPLEDAFKEFVKTDNRFEDISYCPKCYKKLNDETRLERDKMRLAGFPPSDYECEKVPLRGLPILEAKELKFTSLHITYPEGLPEHLERELDKTIKDSFFVICPECLYAAGTVQEAPGGTDP